MLLVERLYMSAKTVILLISNLQAVDRDSFAILGYMICY